MGVENVWKSEGGTTRKKYHMPEGVYKIVNTGIKGKKVRGVRGEEKRIVSRARKEKLTCGQERLSWRVGEPGKEV